MYFLWLTSAAPVIPRNPNKVAAGNRRYSGMGLEKVSNADLENGKGAVEKLRAMLPDLKESLEIGSEAGSRYPEKPFGIIIPKKLYLDLVKRGASSTSSARTCTSNFSLRSPWVWEWIKTGCNEVGGLLVF
jgi:hypothetical protein